MVVLHQPLELESRGIAISARDSENIGAFRSPVLVWVVRIAVPFTYAASKNHIYTSRASGHISLRKEANQMRAAIGLSVKQALSGRPIKQNKLWVDIFVQKPNHKGDAVNVVDLVCDAIKAVIPVDDRWFCLRGVDWQITKSNPMIYIGIGQEHVEDAQVCSSCGRILALTEFAANRANKRGHGRNCHECRRSTPPLTEPLPMLGHNGNPF
jgi:hypothetical protein